MKRFKYIILAVCFGALPLSSSAQKKAMTLQECIDMALNNNLYMKAGTVSVGKARDLQGTAFDMEKTSVTLSQDPTSGGGDNGITVSQSFEFPTVYAARRKYLKAETAVAQSCLAVTRNEVIRDVSAYYYTLLHDRRTIEILQAQDSVYDRFVSLASARCKAGAAGNLELINAERIRNENRIEMEKAEKSYRSAMLAFRQLLNTDTVVVPADVSLSVIRQEMPEASASFEQTPLGGMYAAQITASERNLSLAKQGYMPGLSIGLKGQLLIKGFNPYGIERNRFEKGNFMGVEVGVRVPLFWGSQKAKVKAARRDVELAEISRRQAEQRMNKEYHDGLNELFRAQKVLDYYIALGNGQAERMSRLSQASYENGEIGYVEYIQNQQTALDVQLRYADAVNDYNQAIITLNYIKGNK